MLLRVPRRPACGQPTLLHGANASAIAEASAVPLIVGMALTLVVLTGSIDLSVEA